MTGPLHDAQPELQTAAWTACILLRSYDLTVCAPPRAGATVPGPMLRESAALDPDDGLLLQVPRQQAHGDWMAIHVRSLADTALAIT